MNRPPHADMPSVPEPGQKADPAAAAQPDRWTALRRHTPARVALGRAGASLPTDEVLRFAAAHAQARDAVHVPLDLPALIQALTEALTQAWPAAMNAGDATGPGGRTDPTDPALPTNPSDPREFDPLAALPVLEQVHSRAADRATYLRRPDLGRRLRPEDAERLAQRGAQGDAQPYDLVIVLGDGLSAGAVQRHGPAVLRALLQAWAGDERPSADRPQRIASQAPRLAPIVIAEQARVALADEIGYCLNARLALILLGERPGLSSPDSLGAYLTHAPRVGCVDAQRNCVSNIRPEGLPPEAAAHRLAWLVREALRRRVTGIALKDDSAVAPLTAADSPTDPRPC